VNRLEFAQTVTGFISLFCKNCSMDSCYSLPEVGYIQARFFLLGRKISVEHLLQF
jgi:hypothetical protein